MSDTSTNVWRYECMQSITSHVQDYAEEVSSGSEGRWLHGQKITWLVFLLHAPFEGSGGIEADEMTDYFIQVVLYLAYKTPPRSITLLDSDANHWTSIKYYHW